MELKIGLWLVGCICICVHELMRDRETKTEIDCVLKGVILNR